MAANKQTQAEVIKDEVIKNKAQQTHESEELSDEDLESVAGGWSASGTWRHKLGFRHHRPRDV
ncbi:MAG: hypothetical protein WBF90_23735 [Rivularia sp. (in: cyanobacteria)]